MPDIHDTGQDNHVEPVYYVGIGASASGLEALDLSEARLNSLYNSAQVGIILEQQGSIAELNHRICALTGFEYAELLGESLERLFSSADDYQQIIGLINGEDASPVMHECEWRTKTGDGIPVLLSASLLHPTCPEAGHTWTVIDIRQRRDALNQARQSTALTQALMEHIQETVLCFDDAGVLTSVNPAAADLFGLRPDELIGIRFDDALFACNAIDGARLSDGLAIKETLRTGLKAHRDCVELIRRQQPQRVWCRVDTIPLFGNGRSTPASVCVILSDTDPSTPTPYGTSGGANA